MTISQLTNLKIKIIEKEFHILFSRFQFWITENCNVLILTFNFHFCRKTTGHLGTQISNKFTDSFQKSKSLGTDLVFKEKLKLRKNR